MSVTVGLLALATVVVAVALAVSTVPALAVASVVALASGCAGARIMWTEIVRSRRSHARDRAAQAGAFRVLFAGRSREHAAFATAMSDRLSARDREVRELEGTLRLSEARAHDAERRVRRESRRADQAQERVRDLELVLAIRTAEEADELATWQSGCDLDTVVDLLAWEDQRSDVRPAPQPARPSVPRAGTQASAAQRRA